VPLNFEKCTRTYIIWVSLNFDKRTQKTQVPCVYLCSSCPLPTGTYMFIIDLCYRTIGVFYRPCMVTVLWDKTSSSAARCCSVTGIWRSSRKVTSLGLHAGFQLTSTAVLWPGTATLGATTLNVLQHKQMVHEHLEHDNATVVILIHRTRRNTRHTLTYHNSVFRRR
jgi:hypothetical protein